MVSRSEVADQSRRAGSLSGRSTRSKHHRGRSHHGGSTYRPQNEFPFFAQTGDVEITITADGQEKRYLLHRLILAQNSGFFEAGTSPEWSQAARNATTTAPQAETALSRIGEDAEKVTPATPQIDPRSINGPTGGRRWSYELDWDNTEDDEEPMLIQKAPTSGSLFNNDFYPPPPPPAPRSKPPPAHAGGFFRSMANLGLGAQSSLHLPSTQTSQPETNPLLRDYDNLFRIFYHYPPNLNPTYLPSAYSECKALLALADMYDALSIVGPKIDHHLLRFSSRLFKQIAKYPPSYLRLGYLARSRIIFTEALVHVVGRWPLDKPQLRAPPEADTSNSGVGYDLPDSVLMLIEDKVDDLEDLKLRIEAKLFRLTLTTSRGDRVTPANDYLGWLAMSLFRQWVAEATTPPVQSILRPSSSTNNPNLNANPNTQTHTSTTTARPPPNTGRIFRLLGSTNSQSYLPHDDLKRFLKLSSSSSGSGGGSAGSGSLYSRDTLRRFERKVEEVKNLARDVVKPLTRNFLELDLKSGGVEGEGSLVQYLTCTRVEEGSCLGICWIEGLGGCGGRDG